jgi:secreted Zn-dependent insulinase-like peptidase
MLFAKPLLLKDSMEREIQAVESEFKGCYNDDNCRLWELMGRYSEGNDKRHLLNRFTWGNIKSLTGEETMDKADSDALWQDLHTFFKQ